MHSGCWDISPTGINILFTFISGIALGLFLKRYTFNKSFILLSILLIAAISPTYIYEAIKSKEYVQTTDYATAYQGISKANIIDSVFSQHAPKSYFEDEVKSSHIYYSVDTVIKLNLNNDQQLDYYIVTKEGETPLYTSYFYDGKTGKELKVDPTLEKGPHSEYEMTSKKVNTYSLPRQDAILTSSTISCLIGEQVDLWRYNPYTQQIENELTFNTTNGNCAVLSDSVFYSNLYNYSESAIDTVFIYPGKTIQKGSRISIDNIQPTSSHPLYYFVFNTEIDEWLKNK